MPDEMSLRNKICEIGRRLTKLDLVGANEGNISARLSPEALLVTRSGCCKGNLTPDDIVKTDNAGNPLDGGIPSSEFLMHWRIYERVASCQAIVHAHPKTATAFTLIKDGFPSDVLPESSFVLGPVAMVPFSFPGTEEVPINMYPFLAKHSTFLLSHHGAVTLGQSLDQACEKMEILERVSQVLFMARSMGDLVPMPAEAAQRILDIRSQREKL